MSACFAPASTMRASSGTSISSRPLADRLEDLKNVTFQAKLGSYLDKTQRMVALRKELAQMSTPMCMPPRVRANFPSAIFPRRW